MGVNSPYPEQIANDQNLRDVVQYVDTYDAEHMNDVRAFIRDITATLGINPHGLCQDLVSRLDVSIKGDGIIKSPQQVIRVAKDLGDFKSIQAAIDSITDADYSKPYLIQVYPGTYDEEVQLKNCVNVVAINPDQTVIKRTVSYFAEDESSVYFSVPVYASSGYGLHVNAQDSLIYVLSPVRSSASYALCAEEGEVHVKSYLCSYYESCIKISGGGVYLSYAMVICSRYNSQGHAIELEYGSLLAKFSSIHSAHPDAYSIIAPAARNIAVFGSFSNRSMHANITNTIPDGLSIASSLPIIL